jgi:hypothetical protein
MIRDRSTGFVLALVLILASTAASADEPLTILSPVSYKDGITVRDAVKAECDLLEKVPGFIEEFAKKNNSVKLVEDIAGAKGRVLKVQIADIGERGGPSAKSLTITGELREKGKVIGTITAQRTTMGGPWGFGGVCRSLQRCAKTLGKDVAAWIEQPAMDVNLTN